MKTICSPLIYLLTLLVVGAVTAQTQESRTVSHFIINRNLPFVYLKFDHVGEGEPRSEDEPSLRVWLKLINNCMVPIIVHTFGVPEGGPKYEQGVMYEVVANPRVTGGAILLPKTDEATEQKEPVQPTEAKSEPDETPIGYMFHVGSFQSMAPSEEVLFSVPVNHLDSRWHIEIPIKFNLPSGKGSRDSTTGGQPKMVLEYSLWDLPAGIRKEVEKKPSCRDCARSK